MDGLGILAQAAKAAAENPETSTTQIPPLETFWTHIQGLGLVESLTFISFGVVCLFYGWRIFKILVCICFGIAGLYTGGWLNQFIKGNVILLSTIVAALFAFFAVPLMRWAVSLLGAAAGGILTTGLWLAFGLPMDYFWAGGLVGLVAGGMLSFIVFKGAIMLFTCLGGSALMMTGILAIFNKNVISPERLHELLLHTAWFLPVMFGVPMIAGLFLQHKFIKKSADWSL